MTSLATRLQEIADGAKKRIPEDKRVIMSRATQDLRESGILDGVIKPGDPLPPLALPSAAGDVVETGTLLSSGPVVVTVFRGSW